MTCTLGTDSCLQMLTGGKYGKWEVLQDITVAGIISCADIAVEDTENRVLLMTMNYRFNIPSSAL